MSTGVLSKLGHALLNILSELFKVNIKVSLDRRKLIYDHFFNKLSLDSIQLLSRVHCINSVHFIINSVDLLLTSVEGNLELNQFLL